MNNIHMNVTLEKGIIDDIRKKRKRHGFNLSDWIRSKYREEFMDIHLKRDKIAQYIQRLKSLREEIMEIKKREQAYSDILSRTEQRFLKQIPRLLKEGKEWKRLLNRFNVSFNRDFPLYKFRKLVRILTNEKKPK